MGLLTVPGAGGRPMVLRLGKPNTYKFSKPQQKFIATLANSLQLKEAFVAAWVANEVSEGTEKTNRNNYNYLNIGMTDTGDVGASDGVWQDPVKAAKATAKWAKGISQPGVAYGHASSEIVKAIKAMPGRSAAEQGKLIQNSPWASGHYPQLQSLIKRYANYKSDPSIAAGDTVTEAVTDAGKTVVDAATSPFQIAGKFFELFSMLFKSDTWVRIGKVILGFALVMLAVSKLTGVGPTDVIPAGRIAKAVS